MLKIKKLKKVSNNIKQPQKKKLKISYWQKFKETIYLMEKSLIIYIRNNIYKVIDNYLQDNLAYIIIKDFLVQFFDFYIKYNFFKISFWIIVLIYYNNIEIKLDIDSFIIYYKFLLTLGIFSYWVLLRLIKYCLNFYFISFILQFVVIIEVYFVIEYLIWCLIHHPYLYAILLGINIGFLTSQFIFVKWYKTPYKYQRLWVRKTLRSLRFPRHRELLYERYNDFWQKRWLDSTKKYWYHYYNYLSLKKEYKNLNQKLIEAKLKIVKLEREIVKRDFFE